MIVSMTILNMCGKLVDIDRSYCGATGVIKMMRACTSPLLQLKNQTSYSRCVGALERRILLILGSHILHSRIATEVISQLTQWNIVNELYWLHACLLFDIFYISSQSLNFTQTDIAEAIYDIVTSNIAGRKTKALDNMLTCVKHFADTRPHSTNQKDADLLADPYCGIRTRHSKNPVLATVYAKK